MPVEDAVWYTVHEVQRGTCIPFVNTDTDSVPRPLFAHLSNARPDKTTSSWQLTPL
jgi:hypothetical protein